MNWVDITIVSIVGISVFIGFIRGFIREALSLIAWVVAAWVAFHYYQPLSANLTQEIQRSGLRVLVSFGGLFLGTLIAMAILNYFISFLVDKTGLSGTDRIFGILFGSARGVMVVTVILLFLQFTPLINDTWYKESQMIPHFKPVVFWLGEITSREVKRYIPETLKRDVDASEEENDVSPEAILNHLTSNPQQDMLDHIIQKSPLTEPKPSLNEKNSNEPPPKPFQQMIQEPTPSMTITPVDNVPSNKK